MIGEYNKSVILTYVGVTAALVGVFFALNQNVKIAYLCLIIAGICDLFDGVVARRCKRTENAKMFGLQLDSLADMVSFVALPCVIAFSVLGQWGFVCVPYALAGIIRLAWFNISANSDVKTEYFQGLPVTYAALILPIYYLSHALLSEQVFKIGLFLLYLAVAFLFVLNVKIKKPRGKAYVFLSLLAVVTTLAIIMV